MDELMDMIASDESPYQISDKIKELLFSKTADKIKSLEQEILKLDTSAVKEDIAKLVAVQPVVTQDFFHYILNYG